MKNDPIGVFDSGVGGLSVLAACEKAFESERYVYVFDKSHCPYGTKSDEYITDRACVAASFLIARKCKIIIVACNTATNVAIDVLRKKFSVPVIGVEPPIKRACEKIENGKILVLLTPATSRQKKFHELVNRYGNSNLIIAPQELLAEKIENEFGRTENIRGYVYSVLSEYRGVKAVVLGCTHYYFIKQTISDYYGDGVAIFDSIDGVVKNLGTVLKRNSLFSDGTNPGSEFYFL